ncbi:RsiV family protein [Nocardia inohanensis]|uniref:RsiV family protein n=1 Tax=Nocardia inohanensis TaxID=209246 RepID=UPI001471D573|nr:RsiV family protein [Nocardia inohanensis]
MKRPLAHALLAGLLVILATAAGSVIARATPNGFRDTSYVIEGAHYKIQVPHVDIDGADGPYYLAREEFDTAMRAYADVYALRTASDLRGDTSSNYVYIGAHVLSAKLGVNFMYTHGAHPSEEYVTHNTSTDTGQAITLPDLFTDLNSGLDKLSDYAKATLDAKYGAGSYWSPGIAATESNFQNWTVSKDGLRIYLGEVVSHAAGNIVVTVPWSELGNLLKPQMKTVLGA